MIIWQQDLRRPDWMIVRHLLQRASHHESCEMLVRKHALPEVHRNLLPEAHNLVKRPALPGLHHNQLKPDLHKATVAPKLVYLATS